MKFHFSFPLNNKIKSENQHFFLIMSASFILVFWFIKLKQQHVKKQQEVRQEECFFTSCPGRDNSRIVFD